MSPVQKRQQNGRKHVVYELQINVINAHFEPVLNTAFTDIRLQT